MEEWGLQTDGTGRATYVFDQPSGTYDIRITYFDEEGGKSQIRLFVAGEEKAAFKLDEDSDCWRRQKFPNIQVKKGDEITLVGKADQKEQARLDYIEFLP